jgi:hypothetical protein
MVSIRLLPGLATTEGKYNDGTKKRRKEKEKKREVLYCHARGKENRIEYDLVNGI